MAANNYRQEMFEKWAAKNRPDLNLALKDSHGEYIDYNAEQDFDVWCGAIDYMIDEETSYGE
jgi:hypothetical protein